MTPRRHMMLGLLFLAAIGILSYYTLFKTDFSLFEEKQEITVFAEDARGLRKGAPVLYAGVRWGKVTSVVPDIERPRAERVEVKLTLDKPIRLFADHEVIIESASVLGGVQLGIDPGTMSEGEISTDAPLLASSAPDVLAALGKVVEENREPLRNAIEGINRVVETLNGNTGTFGRLLNDEDTANNLSSAIASIRDTFENTEALTEELRGGQGTIGKLIYDTELYDKLEVFVDDIDAAAKSAQQLLTDAREGEGVLGALIYDAEITERFKNTVASIESATAKIDSGDGTVARLINDGTIADQIEGTLAMFQDPEGTIGKLFTDPEVYDGIQQIVADVGDATTALREQRGALGMLFYDTDVRDELIRAVQVLTGSLEEQREAAPIATFLATVFIGF